MFLALYIYLMGALINFFGNKNAVATRIAWPFLEVICMHLVHVGSWQLRVSCNSQMSRLANKTT